MFKDKEIKICIARQIALIDDVLLIYRDENTIDYILSQKEDPTDISIRITIVAKNVNVSKLGDEIAGRIAKLGYDTSYRTRKIVREYDISIDVDISEYIQDIYIKKYGTPYIKDFHAYKPHMPLTKDEHRKLLHLLSKNHQCDKSYVITLKERMKDDKYTAKKYSTQIDELTTVHRLFDKLGLSEEERCNFWRRYVSLVRNNKPNYNAKPIKSSKDNPNTHGEKFVGGGTPRKPKKCRKTAWKRFYKNFPHLDPKNKVEQ